MQDGDKCLCQSGLTVPAILGKRIIKSNEYYYSNSLSTFHRVSMSEIFLGEVTALDPRFKHKLEDNDIVWDRVTVKVLAAAHPTETKQVFIMNVN